jgi:hypothetical protein
MWWFLENACAPTSLNAAVDRYKTALAAFETEIVHPQRRSSPID